MTAPNWLRPDRVDRHIHTLERLLFRAVEAIAPSVFYLLFSDRQIMIAFQKRVAAYVSTLKSDELPHLLVHDGVLKRLPYLPSWLKNGVVFRDHGRCQGCQKDLAVGLLRPVNDRQFDHIIPLAMFGSNDPTNFQLLCEECNKRKGSSDLNERPKFAPYW
jgi:HNH endonuclease